MYHRSRRWSASRIGAALLFSLLVLVAASLGSCSKEPVSDPVPARVQAATRTPKPTFTTVPTATLVPTKTTSPTVAASPSPVATVTAMVLPSATMDANISPLTGQRVEDPELVHRHVLAVRVGNDPAIRPQEGLGKADLVYEEIMEGWTLTRFTALFLDSDAERIRPIRSARLSSLSIAPQYDAVLVHSGASDKIRWLISQASFADLDQYFHERPYGILSGYDWRGRMYTSVEAIRDYLAKKGLTTEESIEPIPFSTRVPAGDPATSIHIPYPKLCVVDWEYAPDSGTYKRSVQGEPHLDGLDDSQIESANIVLLYADHRKTDIVEDSLGSTAINIVLDGSGQVQICRDGVVVGGVWRRVSEDEPIQFFASKEGDEPIPLKPGKTWIQLVPSDYEVTIE